MDDDEPELPRSVAEAKLSGSKFYFTGKPCKHGHVAPRITSNRRCYECSKEGHRKWSAENQEHVSEYRQRHYAENREVLLAKGQAWRAENLEYVTQKKAERYQENREENLAYAAQYRAENPEKVKAATIKWKQNNPEKVRADWQDWYAKNGKERDRKVRQNPKSRLDRSISRAIYGEIIGEKGGRSWESLVGYSFSELADYLERLFQPGMNWENYGRKGWHIDHIVPRSAFTYVDYEDEAFQFCWSLNNLQPLWEADNIRKKDSLNPVYFHIKLVSPHHEGNHHMAGLGQKFNPTEHDTDSQRDYENLPDGIYILEVTSSDVKSETEKTVLKVTYDVIEPEQYKGRKIFGNFNLMNPNAVAAEIGQRQFASLCRALEITDPVEDSEDLHFKAFTAKVGMGKPSKDGQYAAKNEVKRFFFPDEGNLPTPEITGPVTKSAPANDNRRAANDNAGSAATGTKRVWGKK